MYYYYIINYYNYIFVCYQKYKRRKNYGSVKITIRLFSFENGEIVFHVLPVLTPRSNAI